MEEDIFYLGDIVQVLDKVDCQTETIATIKAIELDNEIPNLIWLYLIANETILNDKYDPRVGFYWTIIESNSPYIKLLSRATE